MSAFPPQNPSHVPLVLGRRSTRLEVAVPVTLIGTDADGQSMRERAFTLSLNMHGAEIATSRRLAVGQEIYIESGFLKNPVKARVIRQRNRRSPTSPYEFSIALARPQNIWGVRFTPDDWDQVAENTVEPEAAAATAQRDEAPAPAAPQEAAAPPPVPAPVASSKPPEAAEAADIQPSTALPPLVPAEGLKRMARAEDAAESRPASEPAGPAEEATGSPRTEDPQLSKLADLVQASSEELKTLVKQSQEALAKSQTELEKTRAALREVVAETLESARAACQKDLAADVESAKTRFQEEARQLVQQEAGSLAEAAKQETSARLAGLLDGSLALAAGELQRLQAETLRQTTEKQRQMLEKSAEEVRTRLGAIAEESSAAVSQKLDQRLKKLAEEARAQTAAALQKEGRAVARQNESRLSESFEKLSQQLRNQGAAVEGRLKELAGQAAASLDEEVAKFQAGSHEAYRTTAQAFAEEAEKYSRQMAAHSQKSMEGFQNYSEKILAGNVEEFERTLRTQREQTARQAGESLQQDADQRVESAAAQLEALVSDAREMLKEQIRLEVEARLEEARSQADAVRRSSLETLEQEAQTLTEKCGDKLQEKLRDFLARSAPEMEAAYQQAAEKQRQRFVEQLEAEVRKAAARAGEQIRQEAELASTQALGTVHQRLGEAVVAMKDWSEQVRHHFDAQFASAREDLEKKADEITAASLERYRRQMAEMEHHMGGRLREAARALEPSEPATESPRPSHEPSEDSGTR